MLDDKGITYSKRNILTETPTYDELKLWTTSKSLPIDSYFSTRGVQFKLLGLKSKLPTLSNEEKLKLLSSNGMLIKRPLIISGDTVLAGFKKVDYEKLFETK